MESWQFTWELRFVQGHSLSPPFCLNTPQHHLLHLQLLCVGYLSRASLCGNLLLEFSKSSPGAPFFSLLTPKARQGRLRLQRSLLLIWGSREKGHSILLDSEPFLAFSALLTLFNYRDSVFNLGICWVLTSYGLKSQFRPQFLFLICLKKQTKKIVLNFKKVVLLT